MAFEPVYNYAAISVRGGYRAVAYNKVKGGIVWQGPILATVDMAKADAVMHMCAIDEGLTYEEYCLNGVALLREYGFEAEADKAEAKLEEWLG
jgi:hypothetical protein